MATYKEGSHTYTKNKDGSVTKSDSSTGRTITIPKGDSRMKYIPSAAGGTRDGSSSSSSKSSSGSSSSSKSSSGGSSGGGSNIAVTPKGYAYTDKYGYSHVINDYDTAKKYASGDVYSYNGAYGGGYAKDSQGNRIAVNTPGVKPYEGGV